MLRADFHLILDTSNVTSNLKADPSLGGQNVCPELVLTNSEIAVVVEALLPAQAGTDPGWLLVVGVVLLGQPPGLRHREPLTLNPPTRGFLCPAFSQQHIFLVM